MLVSPAAPADCRIRTGLQHSAPEGSGVGTGESGARARVCVWEGGGRQCHGLRAPRTRMLDFWITSLDRIHSAALVFLNSSRSPVTRPPFTRAGRLALCQDDSRGPSPRIPSNALHTRLRLAPSNCPSFCSSSAPAQLAADCWSSMANGGLELARLKKKK